MCELSNYHLTYVNEKYICNTYVTLLDVCILII